MLCEARGLAGPCSVYWKVSTHCASLFNPLTVGLQVLTHTTISLMCLIGPK